MLILAAALACFHLGNGAMLPLYTLAVVGAGKGNPALFTATTVVVAQAVMIVAALVAMKMASGKGYWLVLLISFAALAARGVLAGSFIEHWGVWPVQALDGIGAGLQSVAVPGLVACLLNGTGRVNVGQGAVMTIQGLGASLSPAIGGGWRRNWATPSPSTSGSFAAISLALWIGFAGTLRRPVRARATRMRRRRHERHDQLGPCRRPSCRCGRWLGRHHAAGADRRRTAAVREGSTSSSCRATMPITPSPTSIAGSWRRCPPRPAGADDPRRP